ncbi:MAG: helix-turn-helix transcriptional regulator [Elusimicrobia bacterium]|nr:helix-turn-helix transcriptional regulator [Candidatus Obscuribacterium magneticum]
MNKKKKIKDHHVLTHDEVLKEKLKDPEYRKYYRMEGIKLNIGYAIVCLREKLGLTQAQLARKIGSTQSFVARLECSNTENCEIKTLDKIARAFGKDLVIGFR